MKAYLKNITKGKVTWSELGTEIKDFILSEPDKQYQLIIGSDSRSKDVRTKPGIDLVTAVVIHRKGNGGRYFWSKERIENVYSLKEKLYRETVASLEAARKLLDILKDDLNGHYEELEIHIDVGENGPSRQMIKELVGMVNGNGFKAKVKPSAFAAASVADKYT
jgi:uncharacterized protein